MDTLITSPYARDRLEAGSSPPHFRRGGRPRRRDQGRSQPAACVPILLKLSVPGSVRSHGSHSLSNSGTTPDSPPSVLLHAYKRYSSPSSLPRPRIPACKEYCDAKRGKYVRYFAFMSLCLATRCGRPHFAQDLSTRKQACLPGDDATGAGQDLDATTALNAFATKEREQMVFRSDLGRVDALKTA